MKEWYLAEDWFCLEGQGTVIQCANRILPLKVQAPNDLNGQDPKIREDRTFYSDIQVSAFGNIAAPNICCHAGFKLFLSHSWDGTEYSKGSD